MNDRVGDQLVWSKSNTVLESLETAEAREHTNDMFRDFVQLAQTYEAVFLLDGKGVCVAASSPNFLGANFSSDPLFVNGLKAPLYLRDLFHDTHVAEISPASSGWTVGIATPVKIGGEVVGVLAALLKWSVIETILWETKIAKTGYVYVINRDQQIIAHPSRDYYLEPLTGSKIGLPDLAEALKREAPYHEYSFQNRKTDQVDRKIVALAYPKGFGNFPGLGWQFGAGADMSEVVGFISTIFRNIVIVSVLAALMIAGFSFYLARELALPITRAANEIIKIGEGDLTVELPASTRNDEMGTFINAFGLMLESLRNQTRQILRGVNVLTNASDNISKAVSGLTQTVSESQGAVQKATDIVYEVQKEVQLSSEKVKGVSDRAGAITNSGVAAAEQTALNMGIIKEQMFRIRGKVDKLQVRSQEIEKIVDSVRDIADQSQLLAVNASIEAAHAGDHGRGFSIVAWEIKNLANQSKQSTESVQKFLREIDDSVLGVIQATEAAENAVSAGVEQSLLAGQSIQSLAGSLTGSADTISAIESSSNQQVKGLEEISSSITGVQQTVLHNVESARELEDAARELHGLGNELTFLVSRFKIDK
jgi:methyl-accepting chemotaxis protein